MVGACGVFIETAPAGFPKLGWQVFSRAAGRVAWPGIAWQELDAALARGVSGLIMAGELFKNQISRFKNPPETILSQCFGFLRMEGEFKDPKPLLKNV